MTSIYTTNDQGWACVNLGSVCSDNKRQVQKDTLKMGLVELAKSVSNAALLVLTAMGGLLAGCTAAKLTTFIAAVVALPTAIIPSLYVSLVAMSGLTAATLTGYLCIKKYGSTFFNQMKEHFNYSAHLFNQFHKVNISS